MEPANTTAEARDPTYESPNYVLPNDQYERSRLEDQALGLLDMMHGKVLHAPITPTTAAHILDIGCGTGVLTRILGTAFPNARVYGVDLCPVQTNQATPPTTTPPNVSFIQGDIRTLTKHFSDPRITANGIDYAFSRLLICGITDWQGYIDDVTTVLKPGGWAEMQDYDYVWYSASSSSPTDQICSNTWTWLSAIRAEAQVRGWDFDCGSNIASYMERAGLVDVQQSKYRVPNGTWMTEERPETERIMRHAVREYPALYHHAIAKILGGVRSETSIRDFQAENARTLGNNEERRYMVLTVTIGRKPEARSRVEPKRQDGTCVRQVLGLFKALGRLVRRENTREAWK